MPQRISAETRAALIHDLIHADFDLTELHSKYRLSPDILSQWVREEDNHLCLAGLCVLADIQTQLLLSRYRLIAAGRLIDMATHPPEDTKSGLDVSRRACVDLLKLELPRADMNASFKPSELAAIPDDGLGALHTLMTQYDPAETAPDDPQQTDEVQSTDA